MPNSHSRPLSDHGLKGTILGAWVVNATLIIGAGIGLLWYWAAMPPQPLETEPSLAQPIASHNAPSFTHIPLPPSLTPVAPTRFSATPVQTQAPTPIPFMEGPVRIGFAVSGRPLEIYRFGTGSTKRLIVAGIHGGSEWNTIALANELITYLQSHPEVIPSDISLYILPNLNPDGEARAHSADGRVNNNGVDLNRNWPVNWQAKWSTNGCWVYLPVSAGPYPASEPETVYLMNFILWHDIDAIISYHSAALGIFPGGHPPHEPSMSLAEAVAEVSNYPYPPIDTGCEYTGNFTDWAALKGIAAIDIELTNHYDTDFKQNLKILSVFLNWKR